MNEQKLFPWAPFEASRLMPEGPTINEREQRIQCIRRRKKEKEKGNMIKEEERKGKDTCAYS